MRGLAHSKRSTAPSNGMDAKSSAGVPLLSPAAAQRCAEGAGLDSGAAAAAQSAMPSIAAPCHRTDRQSFFTNAAAPAAPQLQSRISTSLTDVTPNVDPDQGDKAADRQRVGIRAALAQQW